MKSPQIRLVIAAMTVVLTLTTLVLTEHAVGAAEPSVGLGQAGTYVVLAGTTVTNTGPSTISGSLGVSPGSAVTGFPPGVVSNGSIHSADAHAAGAQADLTGAYNSAAGRATNFAVSANLAGQTLVGGVYTGTGGAMALSGTVTLDAENDPDAVWIFQAPSTLLTGSSSRVSLVNGANPCNVFWQVGSSATLGTGTMFVGTILALTSITATTGTTVQGRLLARNGAVTLDTNVITSPDCTPAATTTSTAPDSPTTVVDTPTTVAPPTTVEAPTTTADASGPTTTAPEETPTTVAADSVTTTTAVANVPTTVAADSIPTTTALANVPTTVAADSITTTTGPQRIQTPTTLPADASFTPPGAPSTPGAPTTPARPAIVNAPSRLRSTTPGASTLAGAPNVLQEIPRTGGGLTVTAAGSVLLLVIGGLFLRQSRRSA